MKFELSGADPGPYSLVIKTTRPARYQSPTPLKIVYGIAPHVTGITPDTGHPGDAPFSLVISGSGFMPGCIVEMEGSDGEIYPASVISQLWGSIHCSFTGRMDRGDRYRVRVRNVDDQVSPDEMYFVVTNPPPLVFGIQPDTGRRGDMSEEILISGRGFLNGCHITLIDPVSGVSIINTSPTVVSDNGQTVTGVFDLRGLVAGSYLVLVTNPDGQESGDDVRFVVSPPAPVVHSVNPVSGQIRDSALSISVIGSDFIEGCGIHLRDVVSGVSITNTSPTVVSDNGQTVTGVFDLSHVTTGAYQVVVINPDKQKSSEDIVFHVIDSIPSSYGIHIAAGRGGRTIPQGIIQAAEHSDLSINILPDFGYLIQDVYLDTTSQGVKNSLILSDIVANHSVFVDFSKRDPVPPPVPTTIPTSFPTPVPTKEPVVCMLNVSAEYGGVIRPNGTISVLKGTDIAFQIESLKGFTASYIQIDNKTTPVNTSFILQSVQSNHTIRLFSDRILSPYWAAFTMNEGTGNNSHDVTFSSDYYPDSLQEIWNYGDGSVTYGIPMNHSYAEAGTYIISHEVVFRNSTSQCHLDIQIV
ncbi:hypothetical protein [Methanospirillum sp.]|uniref:hypothetical protein n=2 Tax=Methanospirillum sp. TaxID=45200 RepID=UPI002D1FA8EF|nr:hypothetical protein [Methanospirillum sp.]